MKFANEASHFVHHGYFEERRSRPFEVGELLFRNAYPGIDIGMRSPQLVPAASHHSEPGQNWNALVAGDARRGVD